MRVHSIINKHSSRVYLDTTEEKISFTCIYVYILAISNRLKSKLKAIFSTKIECTEPPE